MIDTRTDSPLAPMLEIPMLRQLLVGYLTRVWAEVTPAATRVAATLERDRIVLGRTVASVEGGPVSLVFHQLTPPSTVTRSVGRIPWRTMPPRRWP